jgi:spermidine synthase
MHAKNPTTAGSPPLLAVGLLSAGALAYEVLLIRLLAIVAWHHFAFMIVSLALLGYGASGTLLSLRPCGRPRAFGDLFLSSAMGFAVSAVLCYAAAQRVPFNVLALVWSLRQWFMLGAVYLLLMVPFCFAATGIGAGLRHFSGRIPAVYAADLAGAGAGALAIIGLLFLLAPAQCLFIVAGMGGAAVMAGLRTVAPPQRWGWSAALGVWLLLCILQGAGWVAPCLNAYKPLRQALRVPDARIRAEVHHPLGWLAVVQSPAAPLHYAPGLSLLSDRLPPPQMAVFLDGQFAGAVTRFDGQRTSLAYLRRTTASLGYVLRPRPARVLVVAAGAGGEVLRALCYDAARIEAVEAHPGYGRLLRGPLAGFAGWSRLAVRTQWHSVAIRDYLQTRPEPFTLIQLPFTGDPDSAAALSEDYLYTGASLTALWRQLEEGGVMVMPLWVRLPPRATLKLVNTVVRLLAREGIARPGRHLALIRDWRTAVLVVSRSPLTPPERAKIRRFGAAQSFELVFPSERLAEASQRSTGAADAVLVEGIGALLGPGRDAFVQHYKFDLRPPTDDRPFFGHYLRWRSLPELVALYRTGGLGLLEWDYPLRWVTLLQAVVLSLLLMVLPLWIGRRFRAPPPGRRMPRVLVIFSYFTSIGAAFLLIEIASLQRLVRFVHHPVLAAAITLSAFLLGAGGGSGCVAQLLKCDRAPAGIRRSALAAIVVIGSLQLSLLPWLYTQCSGLGVVAKIAIAGATLLPLTFVMGMPFALGLSALAKVDPDLIPWAWSINGCASVISAVLAPLVAVEIGFSGVIITGLGCYAGALCLPLPGAPTAPARRDG